MSILLAKTPTGESLLRGSSALQVNVVFALTAVKERAPVSASVMTAVTTPSALIWLHNRPNRVVQVSPDTAFSE